MSDIYLRDLSPGYKKEVEDMINRERQDLIPAMLEEKDIIVAQIYDAGTFKYICERNDDHRAIIKWKKVPMTDGNRLKWEGKCKQCGLKVYELYESKGIYNDQTQEFIQE